MWVWCFLWTAISSMLVSIYILNMLLCLWYSWDDYECALRDIGYWKYSLGKQRKKKKDPKWHNAPQQHDLHNHISFTVINCFSQLHFNPQHISTNKLQIYTIETPPKNNEYTQKVNTNHKWHQRHIRTLMSVGRAGRLVAAMCIKVCCIHRSQTCLIRHQPQKCSASIHTAWRLKIEGRMAKTYKDVTK